jgi:ABC-type glycerol-3-phosphate transport system substrate-binding protein
MRKGFIILMTIIGVTLFILLGYGDPAGEQARVPDGTQLPPDPGGLDDSAMPRVKIETVVSLDGPAFETLQMMTTQFETDRPHVDVKLTNVEKDEISLYHQTSTLTGETPDVMLYPTAWVRHEAAGGRLLSLDDYIPVERQSQWFEAVRGAVRWNGYLWGVPVEWDPYVFVFRSDREPLIAEDLSNPATFAWLQARSSGGKSEEAEPYGMALLRQYMSNIWGAAGGAELMVGPGAKVELEAAAEPEADVKTGEDVMPEGKAEANETLETKGVREETQATGSDDAQGGMVPPNPDPVASVEAVSLGDSLWAFVPLREALLEAERLQDGKSALSISLPVAKEGSGMGALPPFIGRSYVISPSSTHPAEAAEWIRYVTDLSTRDERSLQEGAMLPVYRSLYGLSSSVRSDGPALLGSAGTIGSAPLPQAAGFTGPDLWLSVRQVMRLWDRVPATYGAPPEELPGG